MHIVRALIEGEMDWKDSEKLLEILYACDTCGACTINCLRIIENNPVEVIEAARARAVQLGIGPMPAHKRFAESVKSAHNVFGESHEKRLAWAPSEVTQSKKAKIAYFVGCVSAYREVEVAKAVARVLRKIGIDFNVVPDEWCCGSPLLRTGQVELGRELAEHNVKIFKEAETEKLIFSCAGCYRAFKVDYPEFVDVDFEILHITEWLEELYDAGKITFKELPKETVTYHDPCHLGRHSGVYEPPRRILNAIKGIKLEEMERTKDQAWCCGAGGGVLAAFRDQAMWASKERIKEAKVTGASTLISACPFCELSLREGVKEMGANIKICDIAEIVEKALTYGGQS
jgi:heterodisulfide reductase subunit D